MVASAGSKNQHVKYGIIDDNCDGAKLDICPDLLMIIWGGCICSSLHSHNNGSLKTEAKTDIGSADRLGQSSLGFLLDRYSG